MSLGLTAFYMHPSGNSLVQYKLWEYYLVQIPRAFQTHNLGPATSGSSGLETYLFQHLACSTAAGFVAVGIGWGKHKISSRSELGPDKALSLSEVATVPRR